MDKAPPCNGLDRDLLTAWLYDECEPAEREQVAAHLAACARCAAEVESLGALRGSLQAWQAPAPPPGIRVVAEQDVLRDPWWSAVLRPAWGLATAAGVLLGVGLALAGVDLRLVDGGFVVQVGGPSRPADPEVAAAAEAPPGLPISAAPLTEEALLEQVRALIAESEQRQQQARSVLLTEFAQQQDVQRRADRQEIQRELSELEGVTDYLVRVSQQ